ncbi:hypothetical protein JFU47_12265 [Pseudomonas sp. TH39(2020)]|uniref:hypothetical protein n=1 Tax=Pseudomonas sp. TH39(2020) TaxID=2796349 RepID=UPI001913A7AB|nr:hypothetical protein [Pseudomonas sp. TH39(2020)]MBK5397471.1 hypothetical protein [Pseudomonas sp. TH39(2020)]
MATKRIDDATIRPVEKIAPGHDRCEVIIGLTDESLTNLCFDAEGSTAAQAEGSALSRAKAAIAAGQIKYKQLKENAG